MTATSGISDIEFRISNFRKRLGKRSVFTGGAWHPHGKRDESRAPRCRKQVVVLPRLASVPVRD